MKRIMICVDSKSDSVEGIRDKLKEVFSELGLPYRIVEICELIEQEESK